MQRQNIFTTLSVTSVMPPALIGNLLDFLITNRAYIVAPEKRSELFKTRFSGHSFLSDIVHRLTVLGKDQAYSILKLPAKTVALREAIDMTFIPIDVRQMADVTTSFTKTLSLIPELNDKLVINVTDITKSNGDLSHAEQFHYRIVRDFLSRSFYASEGNVWISPTLVRYVAKVYSMTIGGQLARVFGLSPQVQMFVQTVLCAFFVGKMTSVEATPAFLKAHGRFMGLNDSQDLTQILAFIEDILGTTAPETLEGVCRVIDAYDHDQLKSGSGSRVTRPVLNTRFASLSTDIHFSVIALEYPPYFLFMILQVLSNIPIGLSYHMKNQNLVREGKEMIEQTIRSSNFFTAL